MDNFNNQSTPLQEEGRLTKKEKYLAKREKKEEERSQTLRKKKNKKIFGIVLILFLSVIAVSVMAFGISRITSGGDNQGTAKIEITPEEYDAGTVTIKGGLVKHTYEVKNTGDADLKISRIWTSCMCTTASLKVGDEESKKFGMHDSSTFWSQKIPPGETGYLNVSFDPAFHGDDGTGSMVREVYLTTNDSKNKKASVQLLINVIK